MPLVTSIGLHTFAYCSFLESVNMPNVISIYYFAFLGCSSLKSITILTASKSQLNNAYIPDWGSAAWTSRDNEDGTTTFTKNS
jgi:hypothetical protein